MFVLSLSLVYIGSTVNTKHTEFGQDKTCYATTNIENLISVYWIHYNTFPITVFLPIALSHEFGFINSFNFPYIIVNCKIMYIVYIVHSIQRDFGQLQWHLCHRQTLHYQTWCPYCQSNKIHYFQQTSATLVCRFQSETKIKNVHEVVNGCYYSIQDPLHTFSPISSSPDNGLVAL